jgi:hypothetical protein
MDWLVVLGVNGGVVHGRGFESLTFWESMVVKCMSWVRIFVFSGVINGGHGRGFRIFDILGSMVV